jgi:hypothetical protein
MGWARDLRRELSARNQQIATTNGSLHQITASETPRVIFGRSENHAHGNFYPASHRNTCANPEWARRPAMEGTRLREPFGCAAHEYILLPAQRSDSRLVFHAGSA